MSRRDVASRNKKIFHRLAERLVSSGITPNQVSVASTIFATFGAFGLWQMPLNTGGLFYLWLLAAAFGIQMRLVCNLIDGLMAVESQMKTPTGELFNDLPDRFSDILLLLGAGLAAQSFFGLALGAGASLLAVLTAYVRVLGASMGAGHFFSGPMAKQHRMFILNLALLISLVEWPLTSKVCWSFEWALVIICIGAVMTIIRRLNQISKKLNQMDKNLS